MAAPKDIAVFGAGGFGLEVAMLIGHINANRSQWKLLGFFDDGKHSSHTTNGLPLLGGLNELNAWPEPLAVAFALGLPKTRKIVLDKISNANLSFPSLVHPSVIIGPLEYVQIGEGTIICAGNIITTHIHIGRHVIINLACTIGHETAIGDYCSFMPACNISGEVRIGHSSYWGTGAKVINRKVIGNETIIGAGAVVITDIPDRATAVGVPARIIKQESA
ncbi:MAG: acetyltransferase [Desulfobacteraceae bacterium]|nr:MAG: acetyltransferase [Desulfobacteraceae bacterium]